MRLIFGLVLLVGLGLAGGAVYMAQTYVGSYQAALEAERNRSPDVVPVTEIYVAARDFEYGEQIRPEDVKLVKYVKAALPEGVFNAERPLFEEGQPLRIALREMSAMEAILDVKLSEPGAEPGLTSRLQRGERAFTLSVDVATGVSGFLRPGDRVDVYWTGRPPEVDPSVRRGDVTRLIQSGVRLVAIDQNASSTQSGATIARTVTVAASPQQVAALTQAQSTGKLTLALVGNGDDLVTAPIEVDQRQLLNMETAQKEEVVEAPTVCTIRTRRGNEVVNLEIPCTN